MREFDSIPDAIEYAKHRSHLISGGQMRSQALIQHNGRVRVIANNGLSAGRKVMAVVTPKRALSIK